MFRTEWSPLQINFSLADYALMASIGLVSFALAVTGVSRQRQGDAPVAMPWVAGLARLAQWRVSLFRFACPTSSATRAQVWFELESSGRGVLALGLAIAMVIPLVFAGAVPMAGPSFAVSIAMLALPAVLLSLGAMPSVFAGNRDTSSPVRSETRTDEPRVWRASQSW